MNVCGVLEEGVFDNVLRAGSEEDTKRERRVLDTRDEHMQ